MNRKAAISAMEEYYYSLPEDDQGDVPCAVAYWDSLSTQQLEWEYEEVFRVKIKLDK